MHSFYQSTLEAWIESHGGKTPTQEEIQTHAENAAAMARQELRRRIGFAVADNDGRFYSSKTPNT